MTFRFLHAADLHLDSPLRGLESYSDAPVEQIRGATRRALENLVELAIDEQVAFVVIAGDLFDGDWKDYHTGLFFARCMGRLGDAGIAVYLVSGNHDAASVIARSLRLPANVHLFPHRHPSTLRLDEWGLALHGQSYALRDTREDLARGYPPPVSGCFNIGILHTALSGRAGHEPYAPTTLDILRSKGYDYWALGHVHQREIVCRQPWVVFPGNLQGRHIRESGAKGCTLVEVVDGRVSVVEHRELDVLRWRSLPIDLAGCGQEDELFARLRGQLLQTRQQGEGRVQALRLVLGGQTPLHSWLHGHSEQLYEECRALVAELGELWLEKLMVETAPPPAESFPGESDSPLGGLIEAIAGLQLSEDLYAAFPELAELRGKLPAELLHGDDPLDLNQEQERQQLGEDVRELLLGRLLRAQPPA